MRPIEVEAKASNKRSGDIREEVDAAASNRLPREEKGICILSLLAVGRFVSNRLDRILRDADIGEIAVAERPEFAQRLSVDAVLRNTLATSGTICAEVGADTLEQAAVGLLDVVYKSHKIDPTFQCAVRAFRRSGRAVVCC